MVACLSRLIRRRLPMGTATSPDTELALRDAVMHQLEWDPEVDASCIGVSAHEGAVILSGFIDSYAGKLAAERAAKRVRGVRAVANDLQVRLRIARGSDEIAADAARALRMRPNLAKAVEPWVQNGQVAQTGKVRWLFHRTAAELAVRHIKGVVAVSNRIEITPVASFRDVRHRIFEALHRMAD